MYTESYGEQLAELKEGKSSHLDFLKNVKCFAQFEKWCKEHNVEADEENATLFFEMHGFAESEITKEFIEPVA